MWCKKGENGEIIMKKLIGQVEDITPAKLLVWIMSLSDIGDWFCCNQSNDDIDNGGK